MEIVKMEEETFVFDFDEFLLNVKVVWNIH
jgi:hypothetical protein